MPPSSADSSAAYWTRVYCKYNAGSGSFVCDSGQVTGNSASCSAANGVNCAEEGNVYCYSSSSCEKQGSSSAGPTNAYNVNWDSDSADCACKVGSGNWNIGFESGTSASCCGDDSGEYKKVEAQGTDAPSLFDDGTDACCNSNSDCIEAGNCKTHATTYGTIPSKGYCNSGSWQGGDAGSTQCTAIVASSRWAIGGETASADCCGDDSSENKRTRSAGTDSTYSTSSTDDGCCTASNKCVYSSSCTSSTSTRGTIPNKNYCNAGTWQGGDAGSTQCTAIVASSRWAIGGETASANCCGDDSSEYKKTRSAGTDSTYSTSSTDDGCCTASNKCVYSSSCTSSTSTRGTIPNKNYCNAGTWQGGDASSTACSQIAVGYDGTCTNGNDFCWDATPGVNKCCGDDYGDVGTTDYFYTPNVGGCIPKSSGIVYDTTKPIITDISSSTSVDYYYNKTGATTGIVYFNSAIADGQAIIFTVSWTEANSEYGEDDLKAIKVSGLYGGKGESDNVYPSQGTLTYTFNSGDSNGTLDIYVRDAVWLNDTKSITFEEDLILPAGTIIINSGDSFTDDTRVNLTLTYSDNIGVRDCAFSNDNIEWTFWQNCTEQKSWSLIDEDGRRYVYYKVRDFAGNVRVVNSSIFLDRQIPQIIINDNTTHTNSIDVNLSLDFSSILGDSVECSFMNDSMPWTEWGPCPTSPYPLYPEINWTLRSGASGIRTVSVKVNTSFGVVREANDSIMYDPEPPTGSIDIWAINVPGIQEANNHTTAYTTVSLKLIYNDNDEIAGCRYANDENLEANFTAWQSCTTPKTWILNDEDGNRTVYYQIKDYAGNIFETNDTIALDKTGAGQDTTPPSAATVIDDGIWTNDSTKLHAIWSGAYDRESEILNIPLIYEYSIGTSQGAIDVVGWTSVETNTEMTHTGLNLIDGQIYFINVRVINSAGLTNESSSDGITVDTIPCQITSLSSSHDNGNWTNNSQCNNPQFSWAGDVGGSGVYGYSYILDFDSATNPDTIPEGDYEDLSGETSIRYDNIIDGKLNFHVRCRDNAGNWGDEEDYAVWIDASPPTTPQMTEHEIITDQENMTFNWTESIEVHSFNVTY
ncbi:MAG: hypothetical protein U9R34_02650, partial [Nanoarchaeota archaeon]|nr:hypothetical protein [Nanoarchaeota archaeon]